MTLDRRKFFEENCIQIFYVEPELYKKYERYKTSGQLQSNFQHKLLLDKGINHLMFYGFPVLPFKGKIDTSEKFGIRTYKELYERLISKI